ncbi:2-methoxy-6-polyprenyl-1,4-benzoquinol methylase, mitochondrial [Sinobacterium norvegicum]|uniref:2-methoxy-6-polyprenyl-1,4-benzoquinol methylase, mitochondrial n=1 Tax=Sinobacterium norvegicum TaxID=1641715 RepID=A0ABN8EMF5_9GAMM|nr:metalloregulator ArsR/SmtB family transcription factor [Sinobacterium norvegicum]CAH0992920.1 2-methoxy-6-polyprenyl-1,4-benzoquinol methylase, mitochondrial [Sinobacterium norvegicum]
MNDQIAQSSQDEELLSLLAHFSKASSDPLRLMILRVLASDSFGVLELCTIFSIKQSAMSHHLKVLAQAELVDKRREGNSIYYRRQAPGARASLQLLQQQLFSDIDHLVIDAQRQQGIDQIRQERSLSSRQFFDQNSEKFREQQDLIAHYQHYQDSVRQLVSSLPLQSDQLALEVGPGAGEFLPELSKRFSSVIALDNSASMLNTARQLTDGQQLNNIEFINGDTATAREQQLAVDCVVMNMVLHHTPSPADIFSDIASVMRPGASLIVTDLCNHDQVWAKESCGDLWLGFEPSDLTDWASQVGLLDGQNIYLSLRNGFRIQVRQFYKPSPAATARC